MLLLKVGVVLFWVYLEKVDILFFVIEYCGFGLVGKWLFLVECGVGFWILDFVLVWWLYRWVSVVVLLYDLFCWL